MSKNTTSAYYSQTSSRKPSSRTAAYSIDARLWSHEHGERALEVFDFQTVKSMSSPSGSWSLSFDADATGIDPLDIEDDDWCAIAVADSVAKTNDLLMFGAVDGARRNIKTDENSGANTTTGRLNGRDFGKAFEVHDVLFDTFLARAEPVLPGLVDHRKFAALIDLVQAGQLQYPHLTMSTLIAGLVGGEAGWFFLPEAFGVRCLFDALGFEGHVPIGNVIQLGGYIPEGAQKLDPYLRSIFTTPYNELWYDLRPLSPEAFATPRGKLAGDFFKRYGCVPTIVYRDLPFFELGDEADPWFALERHIVSAAEVVDEDLGRSGAERYTLFSVRGPPWVPSSSTIATWSAAGGRIPAFQHAKSARSPIAGRSLSTDVARHGVRLLDLSDNLSPLAGSVGDNGERLSSIEHLATRTSNTYALYRNTPAVLSGTLRLSHLRPEIRIGTVVQFGNREFYVEQVQHTGRVDSRKALVTGETALTLMRGQRIDGETIAIEPRAWKSR